MLIAGSLPQVSATEIVGILGGRLKLGLLSDWLRRMNGWGPRADTGNRPCSPQGRGRTLLPEEAHACGAFGGGTGLASNNDEEAGQNTDRALQNTLEVESSQLFSRDNRCIFGEAGGECGLKG